MVSRVLHGLTRVAAVIRRVVGVPDYERYLAHVRARHPGVRPLRRDEFYLTRLEERYNKPGARCC
jgi:uncharacterized short protein YbdD (DUF466 family)